MPHITYVNFHINALHFDDFIKVSRIILDSAILALSLWSRNFFHNFTISEIYNSHVIILNMLGGLTIFLLCIHVALDGIFETP